MSPADEQLWDDYEVHLKTCSICQSEYQLAEEGHIDNCCPLGRTLIAGIHVQVARVLDQKLSQKDTSI